MTKILKGPVREAILPSQCDEFVVQKGSCALHEGQVGIVPAGGIHGVYNDAKSAAAGESAHLSASLPGNAAPQGACEYNTLPAYPLEGLALEHMSQIPPPAVPNSSSTHGLLYDL
jgi:hypothetical protein